MFYFMQNKQKEPTTIEHPNILNTKYEKTGCINIYRFAKPAKDNSKIKRLVLKKN